VGCHARCAPSSRPRSPPRLLTGVARANSAGLALYGRYLVRLCDLVWAPSGRNGLFCRLPGRGGCLGGPTTKWGGQGRPAGHAPSCSEPIKWLGLLHGASRTHPPESPPGPTPGPPRTSAAPFGIKATEAALGIHGARRGLKRAKNGLLAHLGRQAIGARWLERALDIACGSRRRDRATFSLSRRSNAPP
jgi:hypothetical protein